MGVGLLEARHTRAVRQVEELLNHLGDVRTVPDHELARYKRGFVRGWEVPGLCGASQQRLRLLVAPEFPFCPPRVAVVPAPPVLSCPHLEEQGLLCLLSEAASHSVEDIESVVVQLLQDAQSLVVACHAGEGFEQFEDEFQSYWVRWAQTTAGMSSLCRPEGPSRWVCAWHGRTGAVIAEDETAVRNWMGNRSGSEKRAKISLQPIPLLWLPRPLRPIEYPATVGALFSLLKDDAQSRRMLEQLLIDPRTPSKTVLLGFSGRQGASFAGLRIREPARQKGSGNPLTKGFRGPPPPGILVARYRSAPIIGASVTRYDAAWIHGRDHNPHIADLQAKAVVILGTGSLGSPIADLLSKSGVRNITLVDPERLESENVGRHRLGVDSVGQNKAVAQSRSLASHLPHLELNGVGQSWEDFAQSTPERFRLADLVISLIGSWGAESRLNALALATKTFPPVLYGWTEPHAAAGHAVVLFPGTACFRCLTDQLGKPHDVVTDWGEEGAMLPVPACGGLFQPYGAVELAHVHALIADLVLDVLLGRVTSATHRVWIGQRKVIDRAGGEWAESWIARHGDPGEGGIVTEALATKDPGCPECGGPS